MTDFAELGLSEPVLRGVRDMGFEEPTPVQAQAIPSLLAGRDIVAQALTGTGKTAAFGIPLVEGIDPTKNVPQAIVLAPTRELAVQVAEHIARLARHRRIQLLAVYGGQPIGRQLAALARGVHVIVATPGRLMDHMRRGTVRLDDVRLLVLDEADQMLQMGFQDDVEYVVSNLPADRVTALFSATMPQPILDIVNRYMRDPEMIRLSRPQALTVPEVEQVYYMVPFPRKLDTLERVLDARQPDRAIVFCATKRMVDEVVERLQARGYGADALHGDISQPMREKVLRGFREGKTEILVATDVAARGLDVPDVSVVINFDIPPDPEYYVHRIGRTGRFGKSGEAITFVNPREMREMQLIERVTGARIRRGEAPTAAEAEEREVQMMLERFLDVLAKGDWRKYRSVAATIMADYDPVDLAAAGIALADAGSVRRAAPKPEPLREEKPRREEFRGSASGGGPPRSGSGSAGRPGGPKPKWKQKSPGGFGGPKRATGDRPQPHWQKKGAPPKRRP